jgi:hypothetical protein
VSSGPRKARVFLKDLPPVIDLQNGSYGYLTRHRIVSEDKNRYSYWSQLIAVPVFNLDNLPTTVNGNIAINGNAATIVWGDEENRPSYDIFVSFDGNDFFYHGSSQIHNYSMLVTMATSNVDVAIQVASINKKRSEILTICELSAMIGA